MSGTFGIGLPVADMPVVNSRDEENDVMAIANAVEEGRPRRHLDLPRAEVYDEIQAPVDASRKRKTNLTRSIMLLVSGGVVLIGGAVLLVALLLALSRNNDTATSSPIEAAGATLASTLTPKALLESQLLRAFKDDVTTLISLEDKDSAQSKAWQ